MTGTPDYEKYTTAELVDVAAHIKRARYPQRWELIAAELRVRAARGEETSKPSARSSIVHGVAWCSALGFFAVPLLAYLSIFLLLPRDLSNRFSSDCHSTRPFPSDGLLVGRRARFSIYARRTKCTGCGACRSVFKARR